MRVEEVALSQTEVRALLDALCVELGFCLPPADNARIEVAPPTSVDAFAREVFRVEELDIESADRRLARQVRDRIAEFFARHEDIAALREAGDQRRIE